MKEIHTIFTHDENELGIDDDGKLYWNKQVVVTEGKVTLQWWVSVAVILASLSTAVLAVFAALQFFGCVAK